MTTARSQRAAWLGALAGILLSVLIQAPAVWLTDALSSAVHQRVLFNDVEGTIWRGSAQWILSAGGRDNPHNLALPTRLTWRIQPVWQLDSLGLRVELDSACCTQAPVRIDAATTWQGLRLQLQPHQSQWPASWLSGLGAPWNTVALEGSIHIDSQAWVWHSRDGALQGQTQIQLKQLSSRLSTLKPLGSYQIDVQGRNAIEMQLSTLEGALQLQGRGQWRNQGFHFKGEATTTDDAQAALANLLSILGQRQGAKSIMELG